MSRSNPFRLVVFLIWICAFLGAGTSSSQEVASTLDPLARDSSPLRTGLFIAGLVVIAAGAVWLGRRFSQPPPAPPEPEKPRIALTTSERARQRTPIFYEELKERETALENFEETGTDRYRRKVIRLVVDENQPGKDEL